MTTPPPHSPLSPCVHICVIHPEAGLCVGCLRSRDEIARWGALSNAERREIMDRLPERETLLKQRRGGRAGKLARREKGSGGSGGSEA
ncbi:MAG: DUF1289 domain-containing protein [Rhodobacterales bacterium]|nr:MAG: DUF1289 domain-containing protein [Rhodobacterales bacterium]